MRHLILLTTALILLASCTVGGGSTTTEGIPVSSTLPTTTQAPPSSTTTAAGPSSPCLDGDTPFVSGEMISAFGSANGDAAQISGIRADRYPGCERVIIDLLTADGAPAGSLGLAGVEYAGTTGIIRVSLPIEVTQSAITDLLIDGTLAHRAFVVRAEGGNLAVDVHVAPGTGTDHRAFEVDAPSRVVIDLRLDPSAPRPSGALVGSRVVVTESVLNPDAGSLSVAGYARVTDGELHVAAHADRGSDPLQVVTATTVQPTGAWGEFRFTLVNLPPAKMEVYVGDDSPDDGSGIWLTIDLTDGSTDSPDA